MTGAGLSALAAPPADEPPLLFAAAVWSILVMAVVLLANLAVHLLRHWIGRLDRLVEAARQDVYLAHVRGPAAAVIVAATSGYGINILTGDADSLLAYLGLLMALPLPLAMVTWAGVQAVRQADFEQVWPPEAIPVDDRVKVRYVLRRVRADADRLADLPAGELDRFGALVGRLCEETVPALHARRDRRLRRWLADHPVVAAGLGVWGGLTIVAVAVGVGSGFAGPPWRIVAVVAGFAAVVAGIQAGLLTVLRRRSRYRCARLADEVEATAGGIRRRITEQRLGLAGELTVPPGRQRRRS
ncbi:hypothetical protein O7626_31070 [Micromonospora sp. WMMD1102]|uniref:hypothetical protein n=1 Tax=Micromonospora sp. WMMD1102 TaxID=3016105 RepID=UPI0024157A42|nr:hypothetical protein [Micromonospora sp. WMMD1102]MDG4790312.1 hypothetical protein [Micromonospora sp. WMMD1102]